MRVGDEFFLEELEPRSGDDAAMAEREQQQDRMMTATAQAEVDQDRMDDFLIRFNRVESLLTTNQAALVADLGDLRCFAGQQFSQVNKGMQKLSFQAPRAMWNHMSKQQQHRVMIQSQLQRDLQGRVELRQQQANEPQGGEENQNPQVIDIASSPNPPARKQRRRQVPLSHGADLHKNPKNLWDLWTEWTTGMDGLKPASQFTAEERGAVKSKHCRRKPFWDVVREWVASGKNYTQAINAIYGVCGHTTAVGVILKSIAEDRKNGGHPSLNV